MREIKFRGKDIETGEWVQGYFVGITNNEAAIIPFNKVDYDVGYIGDSECSYCNIETVGQFTGLLDFFKKKIWGGDIVNVSCLNYTGLAVIKFIDGAFCMVGENWIESLNGFDTDSLDIIGNIHDNPELLKR